MSSTPPKVVPLEEDELSCQSFAEEIDASRNKKERQSSQEPKVVPKDNIPRCTGASSRQQKIDKFLSSYCKWTSSSTLTERGIKMLQWTAWLLSQLTKNKYKVLSPSIRKLYADLSMMRYVLRLYGMPAAIEGVRSGSWSGGSWKDARIHKLAKLMAYSMVIYHPLEHIAWAKWTMPKLIPSSRVDGNRLSAWSCRFWIVFIFADLISSILKNRELEERKQLLISSKSNGVDEAKDGALEQRTIEKAVFMNKLQIIRNIFFTGPCISWAGNEWATNPLLTENWCNGLSFAESVTCMYQSIYSLCD
jgi:hypothetical protein